jgi:hypothetical protein
VGTNVNAPFDNVSHRLGSFSWFLSNHR